jgi:hypothetical protein
VAVVYTTIEDLDPFVYNFIYKTTAAKPFFIFHLLFVLFPSLALSSQCWVILMVVADLVWRGWFSVDGGYG